MHQSKSKVCHKKSIGLDAGIESFVATPTQLIKSPKFLIHQARKLKLLQRRLKTKISGRAYRVEKRLQRRCDGDSSAYAVRSSWQPMSQESPVKPPKRLTAGVSTRIAAVGLG